jgi:predicted glutamine amidotransferase
MCIIVYKNKTANTPTKQVLKTCFANNYDGAGYMVQTGDSVHINKGFMKFSDFWRVFSKDKRITKDCNLAIHFRISTGGKISSGNCHPYPISDKVTELTALTFTTDKAIAHNGVLTGFDDTSVLNDTQIFTKDVLYYLTKETLQPNILEAIRNLTKGSRLCLFIDDKWFLTGDWQTDKKTGLCYSNSTYKADKWSNWPEYTYTKTKTKSKKRKCGIREYKALPIDYPLSIDVCPACGENKNIDSYEDNTFYCNICEAVWDVDGIIY